MFHLTNTRHWATCGRSHHFCITQRQNLICIVSRFISALTLGFPPPKPNPDCHEGALGLENKAIPDNAITVTSQWDGNHGPDRARLNTVKSGVKRGAWSTRYNDVGQFIQVFAKKNFRFCLFFVFPFFELFKNT